MDFGILLETLTFSIYFRQQVVDFWYFIWAFLVTTPFRGYLYILPCDHDLLFENLNLLITSNSECLSLWILHEYFSWQALFVSINILYLFSKTMKLGLLFERFILFYYFCVLKLRYLSYSYENKNLDKIMGRKDKVFKSSHFS